MFCDLMIALETAPATGGGRVLCDEHRMTAIRSLPAVVTRLGRCEALADDVGSVLTHRGGSAHHRQRPIAIACAQMKLRAKALLADDV
jgi:hypothetical protein